MALETSAATQGRCNLRRLADFRNDVENLIIVWPRFHGSGLASAALGSRHDETGARPKLSEVPVNWDSVDPLARWDAGIRWDQPTLLINRKDPMKDPFKVRTDFSRYGETAFGAKAVAIVTAITTEPLLTLMPNPLPPLCPTRAALTAGLTAYQTAASVAADGSKAAILRRIDRRDELTAMLKDFAPHLEQAAKAAGDVSVLEESGYELRQPTAHGNSNGVPPAPLITLKRGKVSGTVVARVKPLLRHTDAYEAEYAVGESTSFTGRVTSTTGSRITLVGLEVAKLHQVRVRGVGSRGPGDWSDPVGIVVT